VSVGAIDLRVARDHLGVARRLSDVPLSANVRGVWFSMAADYIQKLGRTEMLAFRAAVPRRKRLPFLSYSLREYIEEIAVAAAIANAKDPGEGLRQIWRNAAPSYLSTPFGRSLLRLILPSPLQYMKWLVDHRDHFCNYGRWSFIPHAEGHVTMEMKTEYIWLEYAHRGGAESVLNVFGVDGTVEAERLGPYDGALHIRWQPRVN
jgi:uncharacterized protein (TIGR02265 family)